jgi:hypothetical protein
MNSARKTKRRIKHSKPRNPLVAPVMRRLAGKHRKSASGKRHVQRTELQKMLDDSRSQH